MNIKISKQVFNEVYIPFLDNEDRYLIFYGGGSSGKSYFIAQRWVYRLLHPKRHNILMVRQTADSNRKSTFPLMKQVITNWNISEHFKINETDMRIVCKLTGNEVAFAGLDDVEKIKSITFANGELTHIWCEEATEMKMEIVSAMEKELILENMVKSLGFSDAVVAVSTTSDNVNVFINSAELNYDTALSIYNMMKNETGIVSGNVIIMPVYAET